MLLHTEILGRKIRILTSSIKAIKKTKVDQDVM